jgi:hypothetical protein
MPYRKLYQQFDAVYGNIFPFSSKYIRYGSDHLLWRPSHLAKKTWNLPPEGQSDPQHPSLFPSLGDGEHNQMVALEAQIAILTQQNAELPLRIPEQSHSEINQEKYRDEEHVTKKMGGWIQN